MDTMTEMTLLLLTFGAGLLLRYIPHIKYSYPSTPDAFFFMNKFKNPLYESEEVDYPKLLYQLIRFFLRYRKDIPDRLINRMTPLFDTLTAVFIYGFLRLTYGADIALVATLLFLITPFTVKHGVSLSGRPFGLLLFTVSLLCLTLPFPFNWFATFPMALVMLSHRLSTQTLFFVCMALSLFDWQVALVLVFGFFTAILASRGEYLRILRNHVKTIVKYIRVNHYPNQRLLGLILTPTIGGYGIFAAIIWLQNFVAFPIQLGIFTIYRITLINAYAEVLFFIWGTVCLLLLMFWIAGESFRHLYLAATPFAFFSAIILQNGPIFSFLVILMILGSFALSFYFSFRYEHLQNEFVFMLQRLREIPEPARFIVPYGLLRAAEYFSDHKGIALHFPELTPDDFSRRITNESIDYAIINSETREWFHEWKEIKHEGDWYLLRRE